MSVHCRDSRHCDTLIVLAVRTETGRGARPFHRHGRASGYRRVRRRAGVDEVLRKQPTQLSKRSLKR
jgi:hypothetical protein